ncbi:MAG: hypothetical protein O7H40_10335, partial [Gammaproteobacteria bacterium]|nr:hypothetical protein [Gammaproteobacteria bacterium]
MNLRRMIEKVHAGSATLAVIVLILTGCATPPRPIVATIPVPPPPPVEPLAAPEPDFEFAEDPFYRLLIAEFAGQRGHMDVAVEHYLALAESLADAALAERATRIAIFARDNDAALSAAKLWVELDPEDMEARQIVAAMFIRHGDGAAALHHLEYVLSKESDHPGNRLRMIANLLGPEEDRATALDVMEQLMEKVGDDIDALLAYALLAIRAEQLDRARDAMNRIVERT